MAYRIRLINPPPGIPVEMKEGWQSQPLPIVISDAKKIYNLLGYYKENGMSVVVEDELGVVRWKPSDEV